MSTLDKIGSSAGTALGRLEHMLRSVFGAPASALAEPAEIRRAILRQIRDRIETRGGGEYFFPFAGVEIELFASDPARQAAFEGAFDGGLLEEDIHALMREKRCAAKPDVVVTFIDSDSETPFAVKWLRKPVSARVQRPPARLTVAAGKASVSELAIARERVNLGRMKDVVDRKSGLVRRNDLAFDDSETSVARRHAVVVWDPDSSRFRVLNDASNQVGTTVIRDGTVLRCDSTHGVQLQAGDEIVLGTARVRFDLTDPQNV